MQSNLTPALSRSGAIAVVGATDNPDKFGSRIYRDLKRKGYRVQAVNPNRPTVDGDVAYRDLSELPIRPTIINFVVPASIGISVTRQALELGLDNLWIQPGAESPELETFLRDSGMSYSLHDCIMVQTAPFRD